MEAFDHIAGWIKKYQEKSLDEREWQQLKEWLAADQQNQQLFDRLNDPDILMRELNDYYSAPVAAMRDRIAMEFPGVGGRRIPVPVIKMRWVRYAAAVLLVVLGAGSLYVGSRKKESPVPVLVSRQPDITPGGNHAILTLADGRRVTLDSAADGAVAQEAGVKVVKRGNGLVAYEQTGASPDRNGQGLDPDAAADKHPALSYNTINTPRGGQYRVVLPDGTKVWLNAASWVTYPVVFTGAKREVSVEGEAYFEVAKNSRQPFIVRLPVWKDATGKEMSVEVLGTSFNVNSYNDEPDIRTTLLEGAVRVVVGDQSAVLRPGQQATAQSNQQATAQSNQQAAAQSNRSGNKLIGISGDVNTEAIVAWKNGVFDFQDRTTGEIMRQLARWYDINISYPKGIPAGEFAGKIGKDLSLQQVLKGLSNSGLHLQLEQGRTLVVLP